MLLASGKSQDLSQGNASPSRAKRCHAKEPFESRQERRPSPVSSTRTHSKLLDLDPRLPPMVPVDDYCKWAINQLDQASQIPQDNGSSMTVCSKPSTAEIHG
ncbi:hypothetical protein NEUTE1DRAFT_99256 [Neurospora tetrasperma FGSC 2508]|uniref:Uncharacterized protein n=1 Tax=Neurospora tetrasperma (strain FGSC 2508 / ATCC MYA-4615 / P0657) TaxID=510951 RepID=F8MJ23_NEUT8|nr:uncharacterized protein NEUTE1DRAFT_99256 [Neurospora tetrasperma FGSC 2508]EGO59072.1 hypothetical protein NEUTE1DRAFT_99256 [Neurospora tetrasperma FGSC 2508]